MEIIAMKAGGGRRLMVNAVLNFHIFFYTSLIFNHLNPKIFSPALLGPCLCGVGWRSEDVSAPRLPPLPLARFPNPLADGRGFFLSLAATSTTATATTQLPPRTDLKFVTISGRVNFLQMCKFFQKPTQFFEEFTHQYKISS